MNQHRPLTLLWLVVTACGPSGEPNGDSSLDSVARDWGRDGVHRTTHRPSAPKVFGTLLEDGDRVQSAVDKKKCEACLKAAKGTSSQWNTYCSDNDSTRDCRGHQFDTSVDRTNYCYSTVCDD